MAETKQLKKQMSFNGLLIYALIFMVPIAPFGIYGQVFNASHGMVVLTYLVGFIGMIFTAISYSKMMKKFDKAGSVYEYTKQGLGQNVGFIGGWLMLLDYIIIPALLYIIATTAMNDIFSDIPKGIWAFIFIAFNTAVAILGLKYTDKLNFIFLIAMLILIVVFVAMAYSGIAGGHMGEGFTAKPFFQPHEFKVSMIFTAVSVAVMSFLGFDGVSTLSEEAKPGVKYWNVPVVSLIVIVILFSLQVSAAAWVLPESPFYADNDKIDAIWYVIAEAVGGPQMRFACALLTGLSWGVTNALASQTAVSRLLFSMGRDGLLPKILSKLSTRFQTPYIAILLSAVVSLILVFIFSNHLGIFVAFVNFGALTGFILLHIAVIVLFNFKNKTTNIFTDIISPIFGLIVVSYIWVSLDSQAKLLGLLWVILGIIILFYAKHKGQKLEIKE